MRLAGTLGETLKVIAHAPRTSASTEALAIHTDRRPAFMVTPLYFVLTRVVIVAIGRLGWLLPGDSAAVPEAGSGRGPIRRKTVI